MAANPADGAWRSPCEVNDSPRLETLEPRVLLSGVTIVTHGFQATSSVRPGWLDTMAAAIVDRTGPDTAVYALRIARGSDGAEVTAFDLLAGLPPSQGANSNGETVIMLDWADASGIFFSYTNTATIAALVAPFLTNPVPSRGILRPLAETPIHLIGHSRGASVVSQLAGQLGLQGIWIDQVTTLDPHPVNYLLGTNDPNVNLFANVVFADNYYQLDDITTPGVPVAGSFEANLTPIVPDHSQIHAYYHGTIDIDAATDGDGIAINPSWYSFAVPLTGPRDAIGFHYSRIDGGNRFEGPASAGLHPLFDISDAERVPLNLSGATWPSLIALGINDGNLTYTVGDSIHPVAIYADVDSGGMITYILDKDTNPYNTDEVVIGQQPYSLTGSDVQVAQPAFSTASAAPGTYHLYAQITDPGGRTRFVYAKGMVTLTAPPVAVPLTPLVILAATDKNASETGGGTTKGRGTFTVTRSGTTNDPLTVFYSFAGTAANDGSDYALPPSFVTIPAGAKSAVIHIDPVDDTVAEGAETVVITLAESSNYRLGTAGQRVKTMAIADNESTVSITATSKKATETTPANKIGKLRIARAGGSTAQPLTVAYTIGGTAQSGVDFAGLTGTAIIPAGQKFVDLFITPTDDALAEATETVVITLAGDSSYTLNAKKAAATVTIADNEPVVTIKAADKTATEKDAGVFVLAARGAFTITRKGGSTATPLTVSYTITGTATPEEDFARLSGTATIPAGLSSVTIQVDPIDDLITEPNETVIVTLEASVAYLLGKDKERSATATIADYELAPDSIAGLTFASKITLGTLPFAVGGSTATWSFSDDGTEYVIIAGDKGVQTSRGEFAYEKLTSSTARITAADKTLEYQYETTFTFSRRDRAAFTSTATIGGIQMGTMTQLKPVTFQAPDSIGGMIASAKIARGEPPFASKGTLLISFNQNGTMSVLGGPGVTGGTGTFTYERFNANVGLLSLVDDADGDELWSVFRFISSVKVNYAMVRNDNDAQQHGTMTLS